MNDPIRIMIVEDHAVVRQGLAALLRTVPEFSVVAEASDGQGRESPGEARCSSEEGEADCGCDDALHGAADKFRGRGGATYGRTGELGEQEQACVRVGEIPPAA